MNTGFRTENAYGSGVRDIVDIMKHEIFELGNTGIPKYLLEHHNDLLSKNCRTMLECDFIYGNNLDDTTKQRICESIINDINKNTQRDYKYGLWLADKDTVKNLYGASCDEEIDEYRISDMVLDDLGKEGTLYLYEEMPVAV